MKKILCGTMLFFLYTSSAFASIGTGVMVTGRCQSTGLIASTDQMIAMQASLGTSVVASANLIVKTITEATAALGGTMSSVAESTSENNNQILRTQLTAQGKMNVMDKLIFSGPVYGTDEHGKEDPCLWAPPSYFLQRSSEDIAVANSQSAAQDKFMGTGMQINSKNAIDKLLIGASKEAQQNSFPFTSSVFTDQQMQGWENYRQMMFQWPEFATDDVKYANPQVRAKALSQQTRMREMYVLLNEPFRQHGYDRMPIIPAEGPYKWAGSTINKPTQITYATKNGITDYSNPMVTEIPSNGKISKMALEDLIAKRFTSETYLAKVDAKDATGVLKEMLRLDGFKYVSLLDISRDIKLNNMLLALSLTDSYNKSIEKKHIATTD